MLFEACSATIPAKAGCLAYRYRPSTWGEVIGQDKAIRQLRVIAEHGGLSGKAYWISGQSGTGKTTIARLIALETSDEFMIEEIDASECTPARLKEIERSMQSHGWGKGGRAYIVNEAHGLSRTAIRQLLVLLERLPPHVVFIFTTTIEGQEKLFAGPEFRAWVSDPARYVVGFATSRSSRNDAVRAALINAASHYRKDMDALTGLEEEYFGPMGMLATVANANSGQ